MGQRSIRFPDALEARVTQIAEREDRSFSYVVLRELEKALCESQSSEPPRAPVEKESRSPEKRQGGATTPRSSAPSRPARNPALSRQAALNKAKGL